jgi:hypothetical protein
LLSAALLLVALAGCGGGGDEPAAPAPDPAAGIDDEGAPVAAGTTAQAAAPVRRIDESMIPPPGTPVTRETYSYSGGPRDPFLSVLEIANLGPEFPDLDLVGVMYQERNPSQSLAVLRDRLSARRFTVREGDRLGRMRVASIRRADVTFTIDDYGTERQETLSIKKPEGNSP